MAETTRAVKVAILVEMSRAIGRGMIEGISQYVHQHGPWLIYHHERTLRDGIPSWMHGWKGSGIIARLETRDAIQKIRRLGLPTVDLFSWYPPPGIPTIKADERSVARMAADHLLERGFRQFAYCGFSGVGYSEERCRCFVQYLAGLGYAVDVFGRRARFRRGRFTSTEVSGLTQERELGAWLRRLQKPLGLMACNDIRGQQVLSACTESGISVPDEIAVIGVDNDVLLCQLGLPSLSSIEMDSVRAGYEAAEMLAELMRRRQRIGNRVMKPLGVVARQSTDSVATADTEVVAAVQCIRRHATEGIAADDVVQAISVSRSTLERRFASVLGHTVRAEIDRVRLNRVKELLARTDWPLWRIAAASGFPHVEPLCRLFKRKIGLTPGQYRKRSPGTSNLAEEASRKIVRRQR